MQKKMAKTRKRSFAQLLRVILALIAKKVLPGRGEPCCKAARNDLALACYALVITPITIVVVVGMIVGLEPVISVVKDQYTGLDRKTIASIHSAQFLTAAGLVIAIGLIGALSAMNNIAYCAWCSLMCGRVHALRRQPRKNAKVVLEIEAFCNERASAPFVYPFVIAFDAVSGLFVKKG